MGISEVEGEVEQVQRDSPERIAQASVGDPKEAK